MINLLRQKKKMIKYIIVVIGPLIIGYLTFFSTVFNSCKKEPTISDVIGKIEWKLDAEQVVDDNYDYFLSLLFQKFLKRNKKDYLFFIKKIEKLVQKQGEDSQIYKYFSGKVVSPRDLFLAIFKIMDVRFYSKKIGENEFIYFSSNSLSYKAQEYDSASYSYRNFFWGRGGEFEMEVLEIKEEYALIRTPDYKTMEGINFRTGSIEYANNSKNSLIKLIPKQNKNSMIVEFINGFHMFETNTVFTNSNTEVSISETDKKTEDYSVKLEFTTDP